MTRVAFSEGARTGIALGICVVALALVGLTPSFSWVPELPLLAVAVLLPVFVYWLAGFRVGLRSRKVIDGLFAGSVAGAISGAVGGLSYVWFGKPLLNVLVGLALGTLAGAVLGALGALVAVRRPIGRTTRVS